MSDRIEKLLATPVPDRHIHQRPAGGSRKVDYVNRWYVLTMLNHIFGRTGWSSKITTSLQGDRFVSECTISIRTSGFECSDVGEELVEVMDRKTNQMVPSENAAAESATQALKRACSQLGPALGLDLYRGDSPPQAQQSAPRPAPAVVPAVANAVAAGDYEADDNTPTRVGQYMDKVQDAMAAAPTGGPPGLSEARGKTIPFSMRGRDGEVPKGTRFGDMTDEALSWWSQKLEEKVHATDEMSLKYKARNQADLDASRLVLQNMDVADNDMQGEPDAGDVLGDDPSQEIPF